jgi:4-hydroxy-tetrahydrodipicolinate synthase
MSDLPEVAGPGTFVPPLTPFKDGRVDYDRLGAIVDYVVEDCDATMVIAAGVEAQEYPYLGSAERKELIRRTIDFVRDRGPVAVGISHPSVNTAIELAHFAEEQGAEVLQLLAPNRPIGGPVRPGELRTYFEQVLSAVKTPVMLYLNPGPGADLSIAQTIELARLPGVLYVKESSRDLARVSRLLVEIETAGHARYLTTMQMHLATLTLGGSGVTLPPPAALIGRKIAEAFHAGDFKEAARLQRQLALFPARWMEYGLTAVMKAAMDIVGVPAGDPYPPYQPLDADARAALRAYLETTDLPIAKG